MSERFEPIFYAKVTRRGQSRAERVDLGNRVLTFVFEDHERKADKLKMTVDNWDLANFDTPVWEKGNQLEISWGYVGRMAPARRLVIKKVTGSTKLTIEAYSKAFLMDTVPRTRCFENLTRSQIAAQIATENGFDTEQQDIEDTEVVIPSMSQARMTDAAFMRKLAQREWFEFFVDFDGFHFHKRKLGQAPLRELVWYDSEKGDILKFNVLNDVTKRVGGRKVKGRDPVKKQNFEIEIGAAEIEETLAPEPEVLAASTTEGSNKSGGSSDTGPRTKPVGIRAATKLAGWGGTALSATSIVGTVNKSEIGSTTEVTEKSARRKVRGKVRKQRQATVKMKMNIVGDPLLLAKSVVKVSGVGKRLSGNYYVKSHKHTLGGQGFVGELEVIRDGNNRRNVSAGRLFYFSPRAPGSSAGSAPAAPPPRVTNCAGFLAILNDAVKRANSTFRRERQNNSGTQIGFTTFLTQAAGQLLQMTTSNAQVQSNPKRLTAYEKLYDSASQASRFLSVAEKSSEGTGFANTRRFLESVKHATFRAKNQCRYEASENFNAQGVPANQTPQALTPRTVKDKRGNERVVYVNTGGRQ